MGGLLFKRKKMTVNTQGLLVPRRGKKLAGNTKRKYSRHWCFNDVYGNKAPKDLVVMYDVPSEKRSEREWLLRQLKNFDYIMIQKSVWVGPSPLPKDFLNYLKSIGILKQLRTLKLAKPYSVDDRNLQ